MPRLNTSHASLVISITALFIALGGTAVAVTQIGTSQIAKNAITNSKLANNSVSNSKLRNNSVSNSKLRNNSVSTSKIQPAAVTATQVAPNTFLAANGTAANSLELAGLPASDWLQGTGGLDSRRLVVGSGASNQLMFQAGFGEFSASCTSNQPTITWTPTVSNESYAVQTSLETSTTTFTTLNAIPAGTGEPAPSPPGLPFDALYSIGYTDAGGASHVLTANITGRFISGTGCVFVGQLLTTQ
jgi:hypothetical protein